MNTPYIYYLHRNGDLIKTILTTNISEIEKRNVVNKNYKITYGIYRKLAGAAMEMFRIRKNKIIFLTYTTTNIIKHETINKLWSKHLRNLKENYSVHSYLWVAELQNRGAVHYHILLDMPFYDFGAINNSWNNTVQGVSSYSKCSVRTDKKRTAIVRSPNRAVKYICKYMSKAILTPENKFYSRVYGITHNLIKKPVQVSEMEAEVILNTTHHKVKNFEYADIFFLKNFERDVEIYFNGKKEQTLFDNSNEKTNNCNKDYAAGIQANFRFADTINRTELQNYADTH